MGLPEEMVAQWGADGLVKASWSAVEHLKLHLSSKKFLTEVGLPREELGCISFEDLWDGPFSTLREEASFKKLPAPPNADRFHVIGRGGHAPDLYLDEGADGAVVEIELGPKGRVRFVNSSVESLAAFLLAFRKSFVREDMSDEENKRYVDRMKAELLAIDRRAFSDPENWWPLVIEQMEDGLL